MSVKERDTLPPGHPWADGITVQFKNRLAEAAATPDPPKAFRKSMVDQICEDNPGADPERVAQMIADMGG